MAVVAMAQHHYVPIEQHIPVEHHIEEHHHVRENNSENITGEGWKLEFSLKYYKDFTINIP